MKAQINMQIQDCQGVGLDRKEKNMVNLQSVFIEFHDKIKLSFDENSELRQKRDILLKRLKDQITSDAPSFEAFNQGSYAMHTGITPDEGDFDIDVGLRFDLTRGEYPDPLTVKQWVYDALVGHTKKVEIRRSCVTVTYQRDSEAAYHVDFACYANEGGNLYIAKGKSNSSQDKRFWEPSDPIGLINLMNNRFSNEEDRAQFRRIIRYMKKWKNTHFSSTGSSAPTGIALTALAYDKFAPFYSINPVTGKRAYDDFTALLNFVKLFRESFSVVYYSGDPNAHYKITQKLFVSPFNDLFEKMTVQQQDDLYDKVCSMISMLEEAKKQTKMAEACRILVEVFGTDFPVKTERSYVGHSESA